MWKQSNPCMHEKTDEIPLMMMMMMAMMMTRTYNIAKPPVYKTDIQKRAAACNFINIKIFNILLPKFQEKLLLLSHSKRDNQIASKQLTELVN